MNLKHLHTLLILAAITPTALGQQAMTPVEATLLRTLAQDTTSSVVAYLPYIFRCGLDPEPDGRLILVKHKAYTRLLLEGTHRVFTIDINGPQPRLNRFDATLFQGDNQSPIAVYRKDTLLQFGVRGRFTQRDFFTRYRDANRDWELYPNLGRSLENAWTLHQYDPGTDALFLIGSRDIDHADLHATLRDSVFRFDFPTRQWTSLGRRSDSMPFQPFQEDVAQMAASFEGGTILRLGTDLLLIDIPGNRWKRIPASQWRQQSPDPDMDHTSSLLLIPLGDTLHEMQNTPKGPLHRRHPFPFRQWLDSDTHAVYHPLPDASTNPTTLWGTLTVIVVVAAGILWRRDVHRPTTTTEKETNTESLRTGHDPQDETSQEATVRRSSTDSPAPTNADRMAVFLAEGRSRLSAPEWQLLTILIHRSAEGGTLDTSTVNATLGVGQKDPSVQKSRRNTAISRINRLYEQTVTASEPLVNHERDAFDRRTFRYGIREDRAAALASAGKHNPGKHA